jgi:hypothetical protein
MDIGPHSFPTTLKHKNGELQKGINAINGKQILVAP